MSSTRVSNTLKKFVYCCIILTILLYGRTLNKALRKANIDKNTWHVKAQGKLGWRLLIKQLFILLLSKS